MRRCADMLTRIEQTPDLCRIDERSERGIAGERLRKRIIFAARKRVPRLHRSSSKALDLRYTVKTSRSWGLIGLLVIVAAGGLLFGVIHRLGRR